MASTQIQSLQAATSTVFYRIGSSVRGFMMAFMALVALIPFSFLGLANAQDNDSTIAINGSVTPTPSDDPDVAADVKWITTLFNFSNYQRVGSSIRSGNQNECYGNLSLVLGNIGPIASASSSASSGALTLLPTAGALIGAPAKELWMLYKLVPFAGVMSMLLSLGGNIVPNTSSDYEQEGYTYGGIIGNTSNIGDAESRLLSVKTIDAATFAQVVKARADNPLGGSKRFVASIGIFCQVFWVGIIVFACWFTEGGSVIVWWCNASGWMLGWYLLVAISSLIENVALVPFTKQWTIRVSTAPTGIEISEDAPSVMPFLRPACQDTDDITTSQTGSRSGFDEQNTIELHEIPILPVHRSDTDRTQKSVVDEYRTWAPHTVRGRSDFLHNLKKHGFNTVGQVHLGRDRPWAANRHSFLVILSVSGVSHSHAALRVVSKAISVGTFAAGTALYASASLITISVALTVLCLILGAGVFGRVASMWMVSEMMKENPVIHRVVGSESEADKFIHEMLSTSGLVFEIMGHVFINGKCVKRYNRWFSWSNIFGVLTSPFRFDSIMTGQRRI